MDPASSQPFRTWWRRGGHNLAHAALVLAVPMLAVVFLAPQFLAGPASVKPAATDDLAAGPFLVSDLEALNPVLAATQKIEAEHAAGVKGSDIRWGADSAESTPLNRWGRTEPRALRYKYTFDYYLGFDF